MRVAEQNRSHDMHKPNYAGLWNDGEAGDQMPARMAIVTFPTFAYLNG